MKFYVKKTATWREMLKDKDKYKVIDPQELMKPIEKSHQDLWKYLSERYY